MFVKTQGSRPIVGKRKLDPKGSNLRVAWSIWLFRTADYNLDLIWRLHSSDTDCICIYSAFRKYSNFLLLLH